MCRKQVVDLGAGTLDGILEGFLRVSGVLDVAQAGEVLVSGLRSRMAAIVDRTRRLDPVTIACLECIDPVFNMGNWGPELVARAGGHNLLGRSAEHSTATPWERVIEADPEVLLVAPCGFGIERTLREMHLLAERPGWRDLRAVRSGRVAVADGNRYFNRSGPSVVESIEILAEVLHPREFPPLKQGTCWQYYPAS